ncbi:MAG: sulfite exporter TauE/SafE family protein [Pseudomonadota bacterium]
MNHFLFIGSCVAIGAVSGFLGGLLGIGGGVVIVPLLIVLLDLLAFLPSEAVTPVAVATSLACVLLTSLSAAITQIRARMVEWALVRRWFAFLVLGSFLAGWVATALPDAVFRGFIGAFLLFVAFVMLTRWRPSPHREPPGALLSAGLGTTGGLVSGLAGIGGGNVIVPTLIYFNVPVHRATATSSTLGVPIASAGTLGFVAVGLGTDFGAGMLGYVYVPGFLAIVSAAVLTAPLGVRTAHRVRAQPLRRYFGLLLLLVSGRMLYFVARPLVDRLL